MRHEWCCTPRYILLLLILFFIPGVVMMVAYGLISRELYRGIRFELDIKGDTAGEGPLAQIPVGPHGAVATTVFRLPHSSPWWRQGRGIPSL